MIELRPPLHPNQIQRDIPFVIAEPQVAYDLDLETIAAISGLLTEELRGVEYISGRFYSEEAIFDGQNECWSKAAKLESLR